MYLMGLIRERIALEVICGRVSGTLYDNRHSIIGLEKFNEGVHTPLCFSHKGMPDWEVDRVHDICLSGIPRNYIYVKNLRIAQVLLNLMQIHVMSEYIYVGVSKNRGTPKWMVYNGKPY